MGSDNDSKIVALVMGAMSCEEPILTRLDPELPVAASHRPMSCDILRGSHNGLQDEWGLDETSIGHKKEPDPGERQEIASRAGLDHVNQAQQGPSINRVLKSRQSSSRSRHGSSNRVRTSWSMVALDPRACSNSP
jgi:hypothetical protein